MNKFMTTRGVLSFRQFDRLDPDRYVTNDLAWPVQIVECYANKVSDDVLDALAEGTLELLNVPGVSAKRVSELLMVGPEVIESIAMDLFANGFYDIERKQVTEAGRKYLENKDSGEFQEEKVFGCMFVSRIDGDVFPYFYEGKLPWPRAYDDMNFLLFDRDSQPDVLAGVRNDAVDRINKAFHRYGRITKSSREQERSGETPSELEFFDEELKEQSFDEPETLAEKEEIRDLKNARVKILKTPPREAYVRARLVVEKGAPEKFKVESPFTENITSWYSDCFNRMRENHEQITAGNNAEQEIGTFCESITQEFYRKFPEMLKGNFEQFVKNRYPMMLSCSIKSICLEKYREVFNYVNLHENSSINASTVVTESVKALEMILNNYIKRVPKADIIRRYKNTIKYKSEIVDMFRSLGITKCFGINVESGKTGSYGRLGRHSIMSHFYGSRNGNSVVEKYYFLVAEAYFEKESHFRKLLLSEGPDIIEKLDSASNLRNKFGAHNDGDRPSEISGQEYEKFQQDFEKVTQLLLKYFD